MKSDMHHKAESETLSDFAKVMGAEGLPMSDSVNKHNGRRIENRSPGRLNFSGDDVKNGLGQLVLTLVKLIHELLERQAIRRIEAGSLSHEEIENLGMTLMQQAQEIERLRKEFNLEEEDLNLDLGPLGKFL